MSVEPIPNQTPAAHPSSSSSSSSDELFRTITTYPFHTDPEFQSGLSTILRSAPESKHHELTLRAKCFFYKRKFGIAVDFDAFKAWVAEHGEGEKPIVDGPANLPAGVLEPPPTPNPASPEAISTSLSQARRPLPSFMPAEAADPKVVIHTEAPPPAWLTDSTNTSSLMGEENRVIGEAEKGQGVPGEEPPYPKSFQDIVELITSGKPVPGIMEIPDVVSQEPSSRSVGEVRRKPWER